MQALIVILSILPTIRKTLKVSTKYLLKWVIRRSTDSTEGNTLALLVTDWGLIPVTSYSFPSPARIDYWEEPDVNPEHWQVCIPSKKWINNIRIHYYFLAHLLKKKTHSYTTNSLHNYPEFRLTNSRVQITSTCWQLSTLQKLVF